MKKVSIFGLIMLMIISVFCFAPMKVEVSKADVDLTSKSALLMDSDTKTILYEKNSHEHLPVASMVKMMTILLTLENIKEDRISLEDKVLTSEKASGMGGSQVFIDAFEEYKLEDLFKSVIMASANDGSVALAEYISGSESNFVKQMNKRASELGMNDTNYVNCTGLPAPEQYSSAYDSAILMSEVVKYDLYHNYSTIWMDKLIHPSGRVTELVNTNRLVKYYNGCDGGKTGSTNEAGCCLSASAKRDDLRLISVIVGAPNSKARFGECSELFNFGFANFEIKKIVNKSEIVANLPVTKGKVQNADLYAREDYATIVKKGNNSDFEIKKDLPEKIKAGVKADNAVGKIQVLKNGEVVKEIDIISKNNVDKMSYLDTIHKIAEKW